MSDATYRAFYKTRAPDRDDLLSNHGVLFQKLAADAALYRALGRIGFRAGQTVVDIGGGSGGSLVPFMELGCPADTLTSVDSYAPNAEAGRRRFPGVTFHNCDGGSTPLPRASADVVFASTVFCPILDDAIACRIGQEMRRIVKPSGHILVRDWSIGDPRKRNFRAMTGARVEAVFGVRPFFAERGALPPPIGRTLSKWAPWAYFAAQAVLPAGMKVYALRP